MSRQQKRAVYKKNDREISGHKAKQIEKDMGEPVLLNVEYVEPAMRSIAGFHRDETFNNVRKGLKDQLYEHLQNEWPGNPNIELDESSVGVSPAQSTSDAMTAKELLPGTTLQFKPLAGNGPNDDLFSPLFNHTATLLHQQFLAQDQLETANKRAEITNKLLNDVMKKLREGENDKAKFAEEMAEIKEELNITKQKLETTQQEVKDHKQKLTILRDNTQYIWYRYLLDSVRGQIAIHLKLQRWHDIRSSDRVEEATRALDTLREKKSIRGKIQLSSAEIASYLADEQSTIRTRGNTVAHTAQQYEVRDALRLLDVDDVDKEGRKVLLDCYRLFYEADDVSLHP